MRQTAPVILWLRHDLRLTDHPALTAAVATGRPVIPLFIRDEIVDGFGAAAKFRLGLALAAFAQALERVGSRLVLRSGPAPAVLAALLGETGADTLYWTRAYSPDDIARDTRVKTELTARGLRVESFPGHLLFEPWTVATGQGTSYRVFTPFWNAVRGRDPGAPLAAPGLVAGPQAWPASECLANWQLGAAMGRGACIVAAHQRPGEAAARARLDRFLDERAPRYASGRDDLGAPATSRMSEHLAWGEIGPRQVWASAWRRLQEGQPGIEPFLRQLVWREFAYHLMFHTPHLLKRNWRRDWDRFPWNTDPRAPEVVAWTQGRTGVALVDAAMREMYVTGSMHNRARMIAASYLTKNLMTHWRIGMAWFAAHLTDWDPAANAMGWQWVAGSGPDAAPFFRVFNPETQAAKFDSDSAYRRRWIAEGQSDPPATALSYFEAVPRRWGLDPGAPYPLRDIGGDRARALAAYAAMRVR